MINGRCDLQPVIEDYFADFSEKESHHDTNFWPEQQNKHHASAYYK